jgi:hypothetical protein
MDFFFVRDSRRRLRFLSSGPRELMPEGSSWSRRAWEKAKRKITGLDPRTLLQELAFEHAARTRGESIQVHVAALDDESKLRTRFNFFLRREKSRHVLLLALESLAVPVTGLAALLPGPNVIFYFLAVLMIIQWQALRGINRLLNDSVPFAVDPLLEEWEAAVAAGETERFPLILEKFERDRAVPGARKALWK